MLACRELLRDSLDTSVKSSAGHGREVRTWSESLHFLLAASASALCLRSSLGRKRTRLVTSFRNSAIARGIILYTDRNAASCSYWRD